MGYNLDPPISLPIDFTKCPGLNAPTGATPFTLFFNFKIYAGLVVFTGNLLFKALLC